MNIVTEVSNMYFPFHAIFYSPLNHLGSPRVCGNYIFILYMHKQPLFQIFVWLEFGVIFTLS